MSDRLFVGVPNKCLISALIGMREEGMLHLCPNCKAKIVTVGVEPRQHIHKCKRCSTKMVIKYMKRRRTVSE